MLPLKIIYTRVVILLFLQKKDIHIIRQIYCSDVLIYTCVHVHMQLRNLIGLPCHQLLKTIK